MEYTKQQIQEIQAKIIDILQENGEMRFGKLAKMLIHSGMAESSFIVQKILKRGCTEYKEFDGNELFVTPKTGFWKLVD
ncbi:Lrp/AsnC family transcriptional regulator [Paraclostridium bifermentans]|uniref:Lrp/AsnC family transcriptional regulator n=1 Tax=Paraclostridium bifermentans TaxID=1490 RepID=UPI001898110D|nr:Lrp/AsnC family transcriptional regulator [Paraclostridium bifermentans]